ncbi:MAG: flagellar hook-basal body complex protein FliE [Myxococcales bacterium]
MEVGPFRVINPPPERIVRTEKPREAGGASFTDELGKAVGTLETVQLSADKQADALANGAGNLHEAALALEKADVAMRLATKVRNKFVEAYQEIMRMNV